MRIRNINTGRILFPAFIAAAGLLLFSCTQFFSTSWASWAARDPAQLIPAVTRANVNDLVKSFEDDPDGSFALLKKIKEAHDGAASPELEVAALKAAINSVDLINAIVGVVGELSNLGNFDNPDEVRNIIEKALGGMKNLEAVGETLSAILPAPNSSDFDNFVNAASVEDLAMGAIVLLLGEASKQDADNLEDFLENPDKYLSASDTWKLAQEMVAQAIVKGITGLLGDVLDYLSLT
jgi:hypothetical protein